MCEILTSSSFPPYLSPLPSSYLSSSRRPCPAFNRSIQEIGIILHRPSLLSFCLPSPPIFHLIYLLRSLQANGPPRITPAIIMVGVVARGLSSRRRTGRHGRRQEIQGMYARPNTHAGISHQSSHACSSPSSSKAGRGGGAHGGGRRVDIYDLRRLLGRPRIVCDIRDSILVPHIPAAVTTESCVRVRGVDGRH